MRFIAYIAGALALALVVGVGWQHIASRRAVATEPPGELVDVGGRRLHLVVEGTGSGPTIVLEGGLSGFSAQWAWVQQELASSHTVVSYDRPGLGWSDPDPDGVDPDRIVEDLRSALRNRGVPGPYVFVGHSMGGLLARVFAERFPGDLAGVVLVDASHPEQAERIEGGAIGGSATPMRLLVRSGLLRATGAIARQAAGLPEDVLATAAPMLNSTSHLDTTAAETEAFAYIADRAARVTSLGSLPLSVVTAGDSVPGWEALQVELTQLSTSSRHVVIEGATHLSLVTDEGHARLVAAEVRRITAESGNRRTGIR